MEVTSPRVFNGHTLLELIITLAVAGILLGIAVPTFSSMIYSTQRASAINDFIADLFYTRSESVKRGKNVIFCLSADLQNCVTGSDIHWQKGIVFPDLDDDGKRDGDEEILRIFEAPAGIDIYAWSTSRRKIKYRPNGGCPGSNTTVRFCDGEREREPKAIIISNIGRPRISDTDASGNALVCP